MEQNYSARLVMHFLRAAIFSIAALSLTASTSPAGCSGGCTNPRCIDAQQCGSNCYCERLHPEVSSRLLLARSQLIRNHFTVFGVMCPSEREREEIQF